MTDPLPNKCKYCRDNLPVTHFEQTALLKPTTCPGCGVRYVPRRVEHEMGRGVVVDDDGPPVTRKR